MSTGPGLTRTPATTTTTAVTQTVRAESVTFVSAQLGWVLGSVPCAATPRCSPVLLRTDDGGRTWLQVAAPDDAAVDQLRFADTNDGWAWADTGDLDLWSTHDGGVDWKHVAVPAVPSDDTVSDLEAAAGHVQAVFNGYPADLIGSDSVHGDDWVVSPTTLSAGAGPVPSAQIVLQGSVGWAIEVDRVLISGARLDNGTWTPWDPMCLGGPIVIAASDPAHVVAICHEGEWGGPTESVRTMFSEDAGTTFHTATASLPPSTYGPIASPGPDDVVMGSSDGDLRATFNAGATWRVVYNPTTTSTGFGWSYLGFTTPDQGVAINENGGLLTTYDGGRHWAPVALSVDG